MGTRKNDRQGKVLALIALLMVVFLGIVAFAVDLGWIYLARTQLQSASDAGSLAGGTELIPGLGASAFRTPAEVKTRAETQAVLFTAEHPAGNVSSVFTNPATDVQMGKAALNQATGVWTFTWGPTATPYNAVGVTTRRSSDGTTARDGPLPLAFARFLGTNVSNVTATSVAVIMPATGIRIPEGSGITTGMTPFAYSQDSWNKYRRARAYLDSDGDLKIDSPVPSFDLGPRDPDGDIGADGLTHLFYEVVFRNGTDGETITRKLFDDQYAIYPEDSTTVVSGADQIMELNIYPIGTASGNFGTINLGGNNNSADALKAQIIGGVDDLSSFPDNTFNPETDASGVLVNSIDVTGDPGISGGPIEQGVTAILGQPRAMVLYSTVADVGANTVYTTVDIQGIRFMDIDLSGQNKTVIVQPSAYSDAAAVADYDEEIGEETTFFTRLILAK